MLLPTTIVGSYPQPEWLIDRAKLAGRFPPRVRALELWRIPPALLREAQDDATLLAIKAQEDAGIDIITDGEMRRESYSNRFATALEGVDIDNPGTALDRSGHPNPVPRVVGRIRRKHAVQVEDVQFLRRHTDRKIKISVPGPFTMAQQAQIDFYDGSRELAAMDYAVAVNEEIEDLFRAGADVVQIDEPYMQARPDEARAWGQKALNRALEGVNGVTAVHICFGYAAIIHARPSGYSFLPELQNCSCNQVSVETAQSNLDCSALRPLAGKTIMLGVIDLSVMEVETAEIVAARIRRALPFVSPTDIIVCTDCGMKYLPRDVADGKMAAMVAGARIVREELKD
jgi:5-methyltetrahydropteroyltriglutamate--homocysteine methyltransferase